MNKPEDLYPGDDTVACIDEKRGIVDYVKVPKGGTKHDDGKPDLSLLPAHALSNIAQTLEYGAKKYGRYNFYRGFESHRLVAACLRHLLAWNDGENKDPESGLHHVAHAAATLVMLLEIEKEGTLTDTRRKK